MYVVHGHVRIRSRRQRTGSDEQTGTYALMLCAHAVMLCTVNST